MSGRWGQAEKRLGNEYLLDSVQLCGIIKLVNQLTSKKDLMPRPSNTAVRRGEIVSGLRRAMARRGYGETSIPTIARAAGLTPGLLHYHFHSKKEILLALVGQIEGILRARIERRLGQARSPQERLLATLDAHVAIGPDADPDAVACWVQVGAESLRDSDVRAAYERGLKRQLATIEALIGEALKAEGRSLRKVRELASGLLATIQGAYQLGVSSPGAIPRGAMAPLLREMALSLLAAQPVVAPGKAGSERS